MATTFSATIWTNDSFLYKPNKIIKHHTTPSPQASHIRKRRYSPVTATPDFRLHTPEAPWSVHARVESAARIAILQAAHKAALVHHASSNHSAPDPQWISMGENGFPLSIARLSVDFQGQIAHSCCSMNRAALQVNTPKGTMMLWLLCEADFKGTLRPRKALPIPPGTGPTKPNFWL